MRLLSWNVNSIRQRLGHLARVCKHYQPDVLMLQETKIQDKDFPGADLRTMGYPHIFAAGQKAYNGVAIATRHAPLAHDFRVWCAQDDKRHAMVRFNFGSKPLEVHCLYVPSGGPVADRKLNPKFDHKLRFLEELSSWSAAGKDAARVLIGDLNVAYLPQDVWNHKGLVRSVGHTPVECAAMQKILNEGALFDIARHFVPPEEPLYTWWGYRYPLAVEKDYGWRLDHAWASQALVSHVKGFHIAKETRRWERPSDHVPVIVDLEEH